MNEAHIEHPVRLVQHQDFDLRKINCLLTDVIKQPARCRHQDIDSLTQLVFLRIDLDTAKDHGGPQRQVPAVNFYAFAYLGREFASRCKHQCPNRAPVGGIAAVLPVPV
jgi:hypothetical protein